MRAEFESGKNARKIADRHSCGDHAREAAIRLIVAAGKQDDPALGYSPKDSIRNDQPAILVVTVGGEVGPIVGTDIGFRIRSTPVADHAGGIDHAKFADSRDPGPMIGHSGIDLASIEAPAQRHFPFKVVGDFAEGQIDFAGRFGEVVVQQQGEIFQCHSDLALLCFFLLA